MLGGGRLTLLVSSFHDNAEILADLIIYREKQPC